MPRTFALTLALLPALATAFVGGCAIAPDTGAIQAEGASRQFPLLIYGTSWNNPRGRWNNRHLGQPVPAGQFYVEIMNTHSREISKVMVYVSRCGTKAIRYQGTWLMLQGPFKPGMSNKVVPVPIGMDVEQLLPWDQVNHLLITAVRAEDSDGKTYDYSADVAKVLAPGISNFCATNA